MLDEEGGKLLSFSLELVLQAAKAKLKNFRAKTSKKYKLFPAHSLLLV